MTWLLWYLWRYSDWSRLGWWYWTTKQSDLSLEPLEIRLEKQQRTLELMEQQLLILTRHCLGPTLPSEPTNEEDEDDYELI